MNKKKLTLLTSLVLSVSAISTGVIINANSNLLFKAGQASLPSHVLTINKDTVKLDKPWYSSYVYTSNYNIFGIDKTKSASDEIYSFDANGDGAGTCSSIQAIQSVSVTYQLPSDDLLDGALKLIVGDSTPTYSASYQEEFDLTNSTTSKQTQVFNVSDSSKCQYLNLWYSAYGHGNALIFEITITYQCA